MGKERIIYSTSLFMVMLLLSGQSTASYKDFLDSQYGSEITIPGDIILNGNYYESEKLKDLDTFDLRNNGLGSEDWDRKIFPTINDLEEEMGEQVPGRHDFVNSVNSNNGASKIILFVKKENDKNDTDDAEKRKLFTPSINRVILMFNDRSGEFLGQVEWPYAPNKPGFDARNKNILEDEFSMSDDAINYISKELKKSNPFSVYDSENVRISRQLGAETGTWFDSKIPIENKSNIIKAPYFWGKYFLSTQEQVEKMKVFIAKDESVNFDESLFATRLFSGIDHLENHLGKQVPLRVEQTNWIASAPGSYLVYAANSSRKQLPYEHIVHMYDRKNHEQFMTILWNDDE